MLDTTYFRLVGFILFRYLIAFLSPDIDSNFYKDYFDFLYKTLGILNNEKKKSLAKL